MNNKEKSFENGAAIVVGGSGVIGAAIARGLATMGSRLAITYRSNAAPALALATEIQAMGREVITARVDNLDVAALRQLVDQVAQQYGSIHSVVYAAGPRIKLRFVNEIDTDEWSDAVDADVKGCFNCSNVW